MNIKKILILFCLPAIALASAGYLFPRKINASGIFLTNGYTQIAPVGFRAFISYDGKKETIKHSATFNLNPLVVWNVIWLIPVPNKPEIEILSEDIFMSLDKKTEKAALKNYSLNKFLFPEVQFAENIPSEPYSRAVNLTKYEIISPGITFPELKSKLLNLGFLLPKNAESIVTDYLKNKWHLVAVTIDNVHLQLNAGDSLTAFAGHTLPVKVSFASDKIVYPARFASIVPDIDSEAVPISFNYGTASENVLGIKDEKVDTLLKTKSQNKYPSLPLDLLNLKIDLFVESKSKVNIDGFTTGYADKEKNGKFLTRLTAFIPANQAKDIEIKRAFNSKRVNPNITIIDSLFRIILILSAISIVGILWKRKYRS